MQHVHQEPGPRAGFSTPARVSTLFTALFLTPTGVVDITAASPGEAAQGRSFGGVFTFALGTVWRQNSEQRMTWDDVLRQLNTIAHRLNPNQTAYALIPLPAAGGGNLAGGRFGALAGRTALGAGDNGVEVLWVVPGSPAKHASKMPTAWSMSLVPGRNVITHVDEKPVTTYAEYAAAVRTAGERMVIRVVDHRTGVADLEAQLPGAPPQGQTRFGVIKRGNSARPGARGRRGHVGHGRFARISYPAQRQWSGLDARPLPGCHYPRQRYASL